MPAYAKNRQWIDSTEREGNQKLCDIIVEFWTKAGYPKIEAKPIEREVAYVDGQGIRRIARAWGVWSNTVNGLPPR